MIKPLEEIMGRWGLKSWGDYIKLGGVIARAALLCVQRERPLSTGHGLSLPYVCFAVHVIMYSMHVYVAPGCNQPGHWWRFMAALWAMFTSHLYELTGLYAIHLFIVYVISACPNQPPLHMSPQLNLLALIASLGWVDPFPLVYVREAHLIFGEIRLHFN